MIQQCFPFFYGQPPPVSLGAKEFFPDAKKVFHEAYGLSDPTPTLLDFQADGRLVDHSVVLAYLEQDSASSVFRYYADIFQ